MLKYLSLKEKRALKEFKGKLLQKLGRDVLELKLFGSKARGDFKKNSDIDVFVLLKKSSPKKEDVIFGIATEILLKHGVDLSLKIFSEKEYKKRLILQVPFFLITEKEGVLL